MEERYGVISQLRRAALSVALNYVEGFARGGKSKVNKNFIEIAYGSLKESEYLLEFSFRENYISLTECNEGKRFTDEIGGMLWGVLKNLRKE